MKDNQWALRLKKDSKYQEMRLVSNQVRLLEQEIEVRKKMIAQLGDTYVRLMDEAQDIADQLLEMEYNALVKAGE